MKAETKAKRRVTLSIVGLGWLDESEVPDEVVNVDINTGEIREQSPLIEQPKFTHFCDKHATAFFKKDTMKNYAHPLTDKDGKETGKWCVEPS
jgi:hypothetical protein